MTDNTENILIVDDSKSTLEILQRNLISQGYMVRTATNVTQAIQILETVSIDLVITDLKMPEISGMDLIRHVRENYAGTGVIMITGYASIETAVSAVKQGAEAYLPKPFTDEELFNAVKEALEKIHRRRSVRSAQNDKQDSTYGIIGDSPVIQKVFRAITKASSTNATVLITGESGTGKELVARAIHYNSTRASAPFVPVNCAGIPEGLVESELFGHVKGAFTGAGTTRAGFFIIADGGTIFLDEIGELPQLAQGKLLRILEDHHVQMIGATRTREVDIRVIAATNKSLTHLIKKNLFREDLYFRLNVITIDVPPLRERGNDILLLVREFMSKFAAQSDKKMPQLSDQALTALSNYHWPGNVRELENLLQRITVMTESEFIDVSDLPSLMRYVPPQEKHAMRSLTEVEKDHIQHVLANVGGNKTKAAQILGIDRKTLRQKLTLINPE